MAKSRKRRSYRKSRRSSGRRYRRSSGRKSLRARHGGAKWKVKCGKATRSYHRKKSAAIKARKSGCRVVRA